MMRLVQRLAPAYAKRATWAGVFALCAGLSLAMWSTALFGAPPRKGGRVGANPSQQKEARARRARWTALRAEGRKAHRAKNYERAVVRFRAALKAVPGHPGVLGELGWAEFHLGRMESAYAHMKRALSGAKASKR